MIIRRNIPTLLIVLFVGYMLYRELNRHDFLDTPADYLYLILAVMVLSAVVILLLDNDDLENL